MTIYNLVGKEKRLIGVVYKDAFKQTKDMRTVRRALTVSKLVKQDLKTIKHALKYDLFEQGANGEKIVKGLQVVDQKFGKKIRTGVFSRQWYRLKMFLKSLFSTEFKKGIEQRKAFIARRKEEKAAEKKAAKLAREATTASA